MRADKGMPRPHTQGKGMGLALQPLTPGTMLGHKVSWGFWLLDLESVVIEDAHRRTRENMVSGGKRAPERLVDPSLFARICPDHELILDDDLTCPSGHRCRDWLVINTRTRKVKESASDRG